MGTRSALLILALLSLTARAADHKHFLEFQGSSDSHWIVLGYPVYRDGKIFTILRPTKRNFYRITVPCGCYSVSTYGRVKKAQIYEAVEGGRTDLICVP